MNMSTFYENIDLWEGYILDVDMSSPCPHRWVEVSLFTSVFKKCQLCGEERDVEV